MTHFHYYDLPRHWSRRIAPHLSNKKLNAILVRDFNKFTSGRWNEPFGAGQLPCQFESCGWYLDHRGRKPRYWRYVKHSACHWLVNFNLHLAMQAEPSRPWRILTSDEHSTVWDGDHTLFDFNFLAFGVDPDACFRLANEKELPVGRQLRVHLAGHFSEDPR